MANLWGTFHHQLPNTKLPIDCVWIIPEQTVGTQWLPSDSTVEEIQGICLWPQDLWGHAEVLHERQGAGKQFRACWVFCFLFVLFVLFWDFTWEEERVEREFWKVFSFGLPQLPLKYRAKLLLSPMGTEANATYFLIVTEGVYSVCSDMLMFNSIEFLIIHFKMYFVLL